MQTDRRSVYQRVRHIAAIVGLPLGVLLLVLTVEVGAHRIHGYVDEASFLIQLALGRWLIVNGWKESARGAH